METREYNRRNIKYTNRAYSLSIVAILVSLIPLFKQVFIDKPEVTFNVSTAAYINHYLGSLTIDVGTHFINEGEKLGTLTELNCFTINERDYKRLFKPILINYTSYSPLSILPNNFGTGRVLFAEKLSEDTKSSYAELTTRSFDETLKPVDTIKNNPSVNRDEVSANLKNEILQIANNNLSNISIGKYKMMIAPSINDKLLETEIKFFDFEIHEYMLQNIRKTFDNYRYGVYRNNPDKIYQMNVNIELNPITDKNLKQVILNHYKSFIGKS